MSNKAYMTDRDGVRKLYKNDKALVSSLVEDTKSADVSANSISRLNDVSRDELVTLKKCVDKILPQSPAKNQIDTLLEKRGFGENQNLISDQESKFLIKNFKSGHNILSNKPYGEAYVNPKIPFSFTIPPISTINMTRQLIDVYKRM